MNFKNMFSGGAEQFCFQGKASSPSLFSATGAARSIENTAGICAARLCSRGGPRSYQPSRAQHGLEGFVLRHSGSPAQAEHTPLPAEATVQAFL